jgi:hypothetical protein
MGKARDVVHLVARGAPYTLTSALCGAWLLDVAELPCTGDLEAVSCPKCLFNVRAARAVVGRGKRLFKVRRVFTFTAAEELEAYTEQDAARLARCSPVPAPVGVVEDVTVLGARDR